MSRGFRSSWSSMTERWLNVRASYTSTLDDSLNTTNTLLSISATPRTTEPTTRSHLSISSNVIGYRNRSLQYMVAGTLRMGARRHGQEGALALSGNIVKCVCALVITEKRSANELLMHYFHNLSSAWCFIPGSRWRTNLPTPGKNPASAHGRTVHVHLPNLSNTTTQ